MFAAAPMLAFLQNLGFPEIMVLGVLALLLFGRRLPEVGRSLGRGIVEFKKGLRDVEDEVNHAGDAPRSDSPALPKNDSSRGPTVGGG